MPARFIVLRTPHAQITPQQFKPVWAGMVQGVNAALASVTARGPAYRQWFGGLAARRDIVLPKMTRLVNFLNSANTVTVQPRAFNPVANSYGHTYQLPHGTVGQWFIYIGPAFSVGPSAWATANMAQATVLRHQVSTIAHELSHAILGTNKPARFYDEHYEADAITLAGDDPEYAAWNASNYGFFVEACMP